MTANNARQADVPAGASVIEQVQGTAPGLICPLGGKVVYAVPGVPHEMAEMFVRGILPDLRRRLAAAGEESVIVSRVLRTWGSSESALSEVLQGRIDAVEGRVGHHRLPGQRHRGLKVRLTARAATEEAVRALLDEEEAAVRAELAARLGDIVFGTDDQSMEEAVAAVLCDGVSRSASPSR